jgi:hypothetical protein
VLGRERGVMEMHHVVAKRVANGWELLIEGVEPVRTKRLHGALELARAALARMLDVDPDAFGVALRFDLGPELGPELRSTVQATVDAHKAQMKAAARHRRMAARLRDEGLSGRDIARVLGVSPQRVSQLLSNAPGDADHHPGAKCDCATLAEGSVGAAES